MNYDANNIFARILRGEIPAHVVAEDEHTLAFMDVRPRADGHVLVIPKAEARDIFEISEESLQHVIVQVKLIARAARHAYPDSGVRVIQLNGSEAGQSVFHLHFHVIPSNDGMNFGFHGEVAADDATLKANAARLKQALASLS